MNLFGWFRRPQAEPQVVPSDPSASREAPVPTVPSPATGSTAGASSPEEIRQLLFDAVAAGDESRLDALCHEHRQAILDHADEWLDVPEAFRSNVEALAWYRDGLRAITRYCSEKLDRNTILDRVEQGSAEQIHA
jgi:hypothetical protein